MPQTPIATRARPGAHLTVGRQGFDGQRVAREQYQESDCENTCGVAESPSNARPPAACPIGDGERSDRGQVIRARQHVNQAGHQSCKCEGHATSSAPRSALSNRLRERGVSRSFQLSDARSTARCGRLPTPMKNAAAWSAYASGRRAEQHLIGRRRACRLARRRLAFTTGGEDLRIGGAIFRIVRGVEQRRDERQGDVEPSARKRHLGAMPPSRHVRRQDRIKLAEERLRPIELAAAHGAHAPFEEQLAARQGRDARIRFEGGRIRGFGCGPPIHLRQQRRERPQGVNRGILLRQPFAQRERLVVSAGRLEQRRPFGIDLSPLDVRRRARDPAARPPR